MGSPAFPPQRVPRGAADGGQPRLGAPPAGRACAAPPSPQCRWQSCGCAFEARSSPGRSPARCASFLPLCLLLCIPDRAVGAEQPRGTGESERLKRGAQRHLCSLPTRGFCGAARSSRGAGWLLEQPRGCSWRCRALAVPLGVNHRTTGGCRSSGIVWTALSDTCSVFFLGVVLWGPSSWTRWSWWVPSNSGVL